MRPSPYDTLNPFVASKSDSFRTLLERRIAEDEPSPFWRGRAAALTAAAAPVLAWMRDVKGLDLTPLGTMQLLQFDTLAALGNPRSAETLPIGAPDLTGLPTETAAGIQRYMVELPGFDPDRPSPANSPARQVHGYALFAIRRSLD